MLSFLAKKNNGLLGIDISSSSIKLLELSKSGSKYKVENYASRPLPDGAVVEKNIANLDAVGEAMLKISSLIETTTKKAAVAVSGSTVITKTIEMHRLLSDTEMENQIALEADRHIPYPLEEVLIDYERQGVSEKDPDMVEVLLAACKRENVDARVAGLEIAGFDAKVVDIEAYAMERAFSLMCEQMDLDKVGLAAIIDIGATITTMYILRDGISIYTREQVFGGSRLSSDIQARYGLSAADAEKVLLDEDLPEGYTEDVLKPFVHEMSEQIGRTLQLFFSSSQYNDLDLLVLAGGTAVTRGLAEMVQEDLSTSTIVANPIAKMNVSKKVNARLLHNDAASLMLACGLAIRGF